MHQIFYIVRFSVFFIFFMAIQAHESEKYHFYFWANYNQLEEHSTVAQHCYEFLFNNFNSTHIYPGFLAHLLQTEQFDTIVGLANKPELINLNDLATELIFIKAFEAVGNHDEGAKRLIKLSTQYPENPEIIFYTATTHAQNNHFNEALAVIDSYFTHAPHATKNFIFYFLKAQILSRMGNTALAIENVKKSLELYPEFENGWLFLGLIHELAGNLDEALTNYQHCLKIVGHNPLIERQIMHLQLKQNTMTYQSDITKPFNEALNAYQQNQFQKALQIIDTNPLLQKNTQSRLLKLEVLCKLNKVNEAISLLTQWINENEHDETWYRALHLLHLAGITKDQIIAILSNIEQKNEHNALMLLYKADIFLRNDDIKNAFLYLNKALKQVAHPRIKTLVLYQLALLFFNDKKWDDMLSVLLEAQKLHQNFPPLLNLLAYYYATKGKKLEEAEQLITTVLQIEKNPHFLDTHALILYKKKQYPEALNILNKLVMDLPKDTTIWYHLAKTQKKVGNNNGAVSSLRQAINFCSIIGDKAHYTACLQKWLRK